MQLQQFSTFGVNEYLNSINPELAYPVLKEHNGDGTMGRTSQIQGGTSVISKQKEVLNDCPLFKSGYNA